jgi:hypothetical protein
LRSPFTGGCEKVTPAIAQRIKYKHNDAIAPEFKICFRFDRPEGFTLKTEALLREKNMAYRSNLGEDRWLYVENSGDQTNITLTLNRPNQQQSQGHSLTTGRWQTPPTLYRSTNGFILRLEGTTSQSFVQIQGSQMSSATTTPNLSQVEVLPLQPVEDKPPASMPEMEPMQPMKPMQPLKMGDMSMSMKPMEMKMGNMSLSMNNQNETKAEASQPRFCTQCGNPLEAGDRFCGACGAPVKAKSPK